MVPAISPSLAVRFGLVYMAVNAVTSKVPVRSYSSLLHSHRTKPTSVPALTHPPLSQRLAPAAEVHFKTRPFAETERQPGIKGYSRYPATTIATTTRGSSTRFSGPSLAATKSIQRMTQTMQSHESAMPRQNDTSTLKRGDSTKKMLQGYVESLEAAAGAVMGIPTLRRIAIWASAAAAAYALRQYSSVALGTFVLVLIGNTIVDWLHNLFAKTQVFMESKLRHKLPGISRKVIAGTYVLSLVVLLSTATVLAVPRIMRQGQYLMQVIQSDNPYAELSHGVQEILGVEGTARLESFLASVYPEYSSSDMLSSKPKVGERLTVQLQESVKGQILDVIPAVQKTLKYTSVIITQSIVAFLFSSIIVYDYPNLSRGIRTLGSRASRVQFIYKELAPYVVGFGRLISQAFEVQFLVAIFNTLFTTIGLMVLGLPGVELLSFVTLIFSFIPVVGWIIAFLPMGIVALSEAGFKLLIQVFLMVVGVHSALVLALPAFASAKLKLHPLIVLVVLYLAENFVGIQGLFLVIPLTVLASNLIIDEKASAKSTKTMKPAEVH